MESRHDEIRAQVNAFHDAHPEVWVEFERVSLELYGRGHTHYSADGVMHVVRFNTGAGDGEGDFKINNNFVSHFARRFLRKHPECGEFFRTREMISRRVAA